VRESWETETTSILLL